MNTFSYSYVILFLKGRLSLFFSFRISYSTIVISEKLLVLPTTGTGSIIFQHTGMLEGYETTLLSSKFSDKYTFCIGEDGILHATWTAEGSNDIHTQRPVLQRKEINIFHIRLF